MRVDLQFSLRATSNQASAKTEMQLEGGALSSTRIHFTANQRPDAQQALRELIALYGQSPIETAETVVALGGDGWMLDTLHGRFDDKIPVYGMHRGTVGFLMNDFELEKLPERINSAERITIYPLEMTATRSNGEIARKLAINEVSMIRQSSQSAKLRIIVDEKERLSELACDGVLVSTPAGSTAYNFSAHGPILPIGSNLLALTPISPFRPRRWRGALLPHDAVVRIEALDNVRRRVSAAADTQEITDVAMVEIREIRSLPLTLMFDEGHALDERIIREQFAH